MSTKRFGQWVRGEIDLVASVGEKERENKEKKPPVSKADAIREKGSRLVSFAVVALLAVFLLAIVANLPVFGTGVATENEVTERYIEKGVSDVGGVNLVANMILVYRGFDTFGESTVLFAAAACVIMLLQNDKKNYGKEDKALDKRERGYAAKENAVVLRKVAGGLTPFIFIFSLYVLLNGHLSPGGGFSGGAMLGASLILVDIALGRDVVGSFFNHTVYNVVKVGALCVYAAILLWLVLRGSNGLATYIGTGIPGRIFSAGPILPINVMVGFEVACTMYAFYAYFSRGELN